MSQSKYAILVGSSEFPESRGELPPLPCAATDVREFEALLSDANLSTFDDVQVALDLPHWEVMLRINKVMRKASREDQILLYYSGHGLLDGDAKLHLATVNTEPQHLHSTSVPADSLRSLFRETQCRRIIIVLDCCFAGAMAGQLQIDRYLADSFRDSGDAIAKGYAVCVVAAAAADQAAYAPSVGSCSYMTAMMIDAIRSGRADQNQDGVITIEEVYDVTRREMRERLGSEPIVFSHGFVGSLTIANAPKPETWAAIVARIRGRIDEVWPSLSTKNGDAAGVNILDRARDILELPEQTVLKSYEALLSLLKNWSQGQMSLEQLTDQWYQFDKTDLAATGRDNEPCGLAEHWDVLGQSRAAVLDLINPAYILDRDFHLLDWNVGFDEIIAKPMGLIRLRHVEDFVLRLDNHREVIERSQREFTDDAYPLVDLEDLVFTSPRYGRILFKKIAAQIPDKNGELLAWSVSLNVVHADHADELWGDLHKRLHDEVNWSIYAKLYDRMLSRFGAYRELVSSMVDMLGPAKTVADLGAGTGNVLVELLKRDEDRTVLAVESNEEMLSQLRGKFHNGMANDARRVRLFKGDIVESLREVDDFTFDGIVMVNVLYAMRDRARCMREIYRVLKPGGVLVYSTSTNETDIEALFDAIRDDMRRQGLSREMTPIIDLAYDRHQAMIDDILDDDEQTVVDYAVRAGFDVNYDDVSSKEYVGAVTIVRATKPDYLHGTMPPVVPALVKADDVPPPARDDRQAPSPGLGPRELAAADGDQIPQLFISYAHEDKAWCERIMKYLKPVERANKLRIWVDSFIDPGQHWDDEIKENLDRSAIALLLVTPSFLASDYITTTELPHLLTRRAHGELVAIPALVEHGASDIYAYPYRDADGNECTLRLSDIQFLRPGDKAISQLDAAQQNVFMDKLTQHIITLAEKVDVGVVHDEPVRTGSSHAIPAQIGSP